MTKKKITLSLILFSIFTLFFTSCNADASLGLYRQISQSIAPVGIKYKQILGINGDNLYFSTLKGIEVRDKNTGTNTVLISNTHKDIIQAAHFNTTDTIAYIKNRLPSTNNVYLLNNTVPKTPTDPALTSVKLLNFYPNGLAMIQGINDSKRQFSLVQYDNNAVIATFPDLDGYSLESVIQMTGHDTKAVSIAKPIIVGFVDQSGKYKYYFVDPAVTQLSTTTNIASLKLEDLRIANFYKNNTALLLLTTDGRLFYGNDEDETSFTQLVNASKTYDVNAFAYGVDDGTKVHLITKSKSKIDPIYVLTVDTATPTSASGKSIRAGYAGNLDSVEIVSAYEKALNQLLVATADNGMFSITIEPTKANEDSSDNGSSSGSEQYVF